MRKLVFIIILIVFSTIFYYSTRQDENFLIEKGVITVKKIINATFTIKDAVDKDALKIPNSEIISESSSNLEFLGSLTSEQLKYWVQDQAKSMNSVQNKTDEVQLRLKAQARTLTPDQLILLKDAATNFSLPINDRILSAYMISLNPTSESSEKLFEVAKTEVPDLGPIRPHTEAEIRHTQELAIRYMQIDELFQRAKIDANARDKLKLLSFEASSEQVRSYAKKRLQELK